MIKERITTAAHKLKAEGYHNIQIFLNKEDYEDLVSQIKIIHVTGLQEIVTYNGYVINKYGAGISAARGIKSGVDIKVMDV